MADSGGVSVNEDPAIVVACKARIAQETARAIAAFAYGDFREFAACMTMVAMLTGILAALRIKAITEPEAAAAAWRRVEREFDRQGVN